jgi:hypothetical protein
MAVGTLVQGVWKYGEDDAASPISDTLNLLGASVRTELNTEKSKRSQLYASDATFPNATASAAAEQVVHNRITVPAAAWDRVLVVTVTMHLTYTQTGAVDTFLITGAAVGDQLRATLTASIVTPYKMSAQVSLPASTGMVVEAKFARAAGTGIITPSTGALSRMRVSAHPA